MIHFCYISCTIHKYAKISNVDHVYMSDGSGWFVYFYTFKQHPLQYMCVSVFYGSHLLWFRPNVFMAV